MKVCLLYNYAQHYRSNIFMVMDRELDISFYFGDKMSDVKKMDYSLLTGSVTELRNIKLGCFTWQKHSLRLAFQSFDAIIALGDPYFISTWCLLLLCRIKKIPTVLWTHGWYGRENKVKTIIKRLFFKLATHIMTYGDYARNLMLQNGFNESRVSAIYNSLSYDKHIKLRSGATKCDVYKDHFHNEFPTIVFIGRLTKVKQLDMLLDSLIISRNKGRCYNIVYIGDGVMKESLIEMTNSLGLNSFVWFYGATYDEKELSQLLYNADLCVAPGNIGLTAIHALSFGCPCISHNDFSLQMPEFESIIPNVTGDFFDYQDPESLSNTILKWLDNNYDRESIRQQCFNEIDNKWNPYSQIQIIKDILSSLD